MPPKQGQRVRSFGTEVPAATTQVLTWDNLKPGTYLYEAGPTAAGCFIEARKRIYLVPFRTFLKHKTWFGIVTVSAYADSPSDAFGR